MAGGARSLTRRWQPRRPSQGNDPLSILTWRPRRERSMFHVKRARWGTPPELQRQHFRSRGNSDSAVCGGNPLASGPLKVEVDVVTSQADVGKRRGHRAVRPGSQSKHAGQRPAASFEDRAHLCAMFHVKRMPCRDGPIHAGPGSGGQCRHRAAAPSLESLYSGLAAPRVLSRLGSTHAASPLTPRVPSRASVLSRLGFPHASCLRVWVVGLGPPCVGRSVVVDRGDAAASDRPAS